MLPHANDVVRETVPASHITVGLQCGGSDGYSGITANPALGAAVDLLVAARRHRDPLRDARDLRRRAPADAPRGVARSRREAGVADHAGGRNTRRASDGEMNNNPSPGNKAGGLTTILEKSLGAVAKGGTTQPRRSLRIRAAGDRQGLRLHGYAGLRPGIARPARSRAART